MLSQRLYSSVGSYVGNYTSATAIQTINLGFTPQLIIIASQKFNAFQQLSSAVGGMAKYEGAGGFGEYHSCFIITNGFNVRSYKGTADLNAYGVVYNYIAFK